MPLNLRNASRQIYKKFLSNQQKLFRGYNQLKLSKLALAGTLYCEVLNEIIHKKTPSGIPEGALV